VFLRFRPVQATDFPECLRCIRNDFLFEENGDRAALLQFWRTLLENGAFIGAVMEDVTAPVGERIAWCCFKVFPTSEFAAALIGPDATPYVTRQLLDTWRTGERLPLLSLDDVRRINSDPAAGDGVTMLVINYGAPGGFAGERFQAVAGKMIAFTEYFSGGYRVGHLLEEFYDDYAFDLADNAGFALKADYVRFFSDPARCAALPETYPRPRLYGGDAGTSAGRPGTLLAAIFNYQPPCFFFKSGQQDLLFHALLGATDDEIATALHLSRNTLKKRWNEIYERVDAVAPQIFAAEMRVGRPGNGNGHRPVNGKDIGTLSEAGATATRGAEKKRRMLAYLRHHFEELRPVVPYSER